ncbi:MULTISPECIES: DUF2231 domain-containing protein [Roseateles]|uniref:Membrane protein n=1 Tax=Pelomonas aquatica TaxID=431058 RepID=A0ABU1ZFB9_9BURK|nr:MULTISPECIES: DUF2231 domain-containing protein [Roseateles]KQY86860.1 hypothetical protein ASD35_18995 [Pelomonas sp. Root1444]MDR7299153.1 putative membrane protein [Pelomonas aquatica]
MESKARLLGHPVHQMLVVFPLGLLGASVVFDLLALGMNFSLMAVVAYYLILAGVVAGLVAAPFGTIDWLAIPAGTRAKSVGAMHATGNVVVLALFAASAWLRSADPGAPPALALVLSFGGAGLSLVTAWLGGELVDRLGVGVSDGAHLDAPSSLSHRDARPLASGGSRTIR